MLNRQLIFMSTFNLFQSMKRGLAVIVASYLDQSERFLPQPSLRLVANRLLNEADLERAVKILDDSCNAVLQ